MAERRILNLRASCEPPQGRVRGEVAPVVPEFVPEVEIQVGEDERAYLVGFADSEEGANRVAEIARVKIPEAIKFDIVRVNPDRYEVFATVPEFAPAKPKRKGKPKEDAYGDRAGRAIRALVGSSRADWAVEAQASPAQQSYNDLSEWMADNYDEGLLDSVYQLSERNVRTKDLVLEQQRRFQESRSPTQLAQEAAAKPRKYYKGNVKNRGR